MPTNEDRANRRRQKILLFLPNATTATQQDRNSMGAVLLLCFAERIPLKLRNGPPHRAPLPAVVMAHTLTLSHGCAWLWLCAYVCVHCTNARVPNPLTWVGMVAGQSSPVPGARKEVVVAPSLANASGQSSTFGADGSERHHLRGRRRRELNRSPRCSRRTGSATRVLRYVCALRECLSDPLTSANTHGSVVAGA